MQRIPVHMIKEVYAYQKTEFVTLYAIWSYFITLHIKGEGEGSLKQSIKGEGRKFDISTGHFLLPEEKKFIITS